MEQKETAPGKDEKLTTFELEGQVLPVKYIKTLEIKTGVSCDVYEFEGDSQKDLAIITVNPDAATPLQQVDAGDRTIESYFSGKGSLTVIKPSGEKEVFETQDPGKPFSVTVNVGEKMQWRAAADSALVFSEVCYPPFEEGRFQNLSE